MSYQEVMLVDTGNAVMPICALSVAVTLIQQLSARVAMDVHWRVGYEH